MCATAASAIPMLAIPTPAGISQAVARLSDHRPKNGWETDEVSAATRTTAAVFVYERSSSGLRKTKDRRQCSLRKTGREVADKQIRHHRRSEPILHPTRIATPLGAERLTAQLLAGPPARDAVAVAEALLAVQQQRSAQSTSGQPYRPTRPDRPGRASERRGSIAPLSARYARLARAEADEVAAQAGGSGRCTEARDAEGRLTFSRLCWVLSPRPGNTPPRRSG